MSLENSLSQNLVSHPPETVSLRQSERLCRRIARSHYENFLVASILLPRRLRQPFYNIYAFCRTADDVADESRTPQDALDGLGLLQSNVDSIYRGNEPAVGLFPALANTVTTFSLSKRHFDDLLSAFRQDQHLTQYETTADLLDYCSRSANPVGRLVLELANSLSPTTEPLSDSICTGLQLANFWQDVARDQDIGRTYLPQDMLSKFGVSPEMLKRKTTATELRQLLAQLCDDAEAYFRGGLPLAEHVPRWLSSDIKLFAHGGLATLDAIREIEFDVLRQRPKVSKTTQCSLVIRASMRLL